AAVAGAVSELEEMSAPGCSVEEAAEVDGWVVGCDPATGGVTTGALRLYQPAGTPMAATLRTTAAATPANITLFRPLSLLTRSMVRENGTSTASSWFISSRFSSVTSGSIFLVEGSTTGSP